MKVARSERVMVYVQFFKQYLLCTAPKPAASYMRALFSRFIFCQLQPAL